MTTDRNPSPILLAAALLMGLSLAGCKDAPSASTIKWQLESHIPGLQLELDSHVRVPRIAMWTARKILRLASEEDQEDLRVMSHIRRVNVATYRVLQYPDDDTPNTPYRFEKRLADAGWTLMVHQRDGDDQTWMFHRQGEGDAITNLYVVALDHYELTIVDLAGRIDLIVAEAFADDPGELIEVFAG